MSIEFKFKKIFKNARIAICKSRMKKFFLKSKIKRKICCFSLSFYIYAQIFNVQRRDVDSVPVGCC